MRFGKFISTAALALAFVSGAHAELAGMNDQTSVTETKDRSWSGLIGISGGNSLIAGDGTIFMSVRIGVQWNDIIANGAWETFLMEDVANPNVKGQELVNYNAFGLFAEITPYRNGAFSVSVPVSIGGGVVNVVEKGEEAFSPDDKFFTGEMALHFNYRVTRMLEVSIGGGYRMFAGISENNLEDMDFCTPFGELRFTFKE